MIPAFFFLSFDIRACVTHFSSSSSADEDICKLYCIAEDFDFFFAMASKVKDGTSCSDLAPDVCIDGICEVL